MQRITSSRGKAPFAGRRVAAQAKSVNASWTKAKLMRMKKAELESAGKELGLDVKGTKEQVANKILGHFGGHDPRAPKPTSSASTTISNPAPVTRVQRPVAAVASKTAVKPAAKTTMTKLDAPKPPVATKTTTATRTKTETSSPQSHPVDDAVNTPTAAPMPPVALKSRAPSPSKPRDVKPAADTPSQAKTAAKPEVPVKPPAIYDADVNVNASKQATPADNVPDVALTKRIAELEAQITSKSEELDRLRISDKKTMDALQTEQKALKEELRRSAEAADAVTDKTNALKKSAAQVTQLQHEQSELRATLGDVERLLKLREREIQSLNNQLSQVQKQQAEAEETRKQEHLAMLAMSSVLVPSNAAEGSAGVASHPIAIEAESGVAVSSVQAVVSRPSVLSSGHAVASEDRQARVYGAAFPALAMCSAGSKVFDKYAAVRDVLVANRSQRIASDAVTATLLAMALAAVSL